MKLTKEEFKELQKQWYSKLKDEGFVDIEKELKDGNTVLKQFGNNSYQQYKKIRSSKEEYYALLRQAINDKSTKYKEESHRYILLRYSEGTRICAIVNELKAKGYPRDRQTIRLIIRRYEIAWKIKSYSPKQMRRKKL